MIAVLSFRLKLILKNVFRLMTVNTIDNFMIIIIIAILRRLFKFNLKMFIISLHNIHMYYAYTYVLGVVPIMKEEGIEP